MNPQLYNLAKNGKKSDFKTLYKSLFGGDDAAAELGYTAYLSQIKGSTVGTSSSGTGSSLFGSNSSSFDVLGMINDAFKGVGKLSDDLLKTQYGKPEEQNSLGMVTNAIATGGANPIKIFQSLASQSGQAVLDQLQQESDLLSAINSEVGISGELSEGLRKDMIAASVEGSRYGITLKEIGDLYTGMSEKSGKFALVNRELIESTLPVATILGKTMSQMAETIGEFEKVGLGADKTIKQIGDTSIETIGLGLNARKIAESIQTNIGKLNEYGFQNGYKGLERMVQKATEFKMEFSTITTIADKVFSPEGAIDLAANLQVLGGAIGEFNDPLKLMYDATNNVEGLQDALIGAAGGLATYNQEQGRFEITGVNLRKAKEMAGALGITMGELNKTAIAAAERSSATAALMGKGFDIPEKDKEFLINMSRMEGGEMKIVVPESLMTQFGGETKIALDSITESQVKALKEYQEKLSNVDPKELAMRQLTETQRLVRGMDVVASYIRVRLTAMGKGAIEAGAGKQLKDATSMLEAYAGTLDAQKVETDQKTAFAKVTELINNPGKVVGDYFKEKWDEFVGTISNIKNNKTEPTTTTQTIKHEITVSSSSTLTDSFSRELIRDNSLVKQWSDAAPNSMTTPNSAIRK
jgi:hypothetical protein